MQRQLIQRKGKKDNAATNQTLIKKKNSDLRAIKRKKTTFSAAKKKKKKARSSTIFNDSLDGISANNEANCNQQHTTIQNLVINQSKVQVYAKIRLIKKGKMELI